MHCLNLVRRCSQPVRLPAAQEVLVRDKPRMSISGWYHQEGPREVGRSRTQPPQNRAEAVMLARPYYPQEEGPAAHRAVHTVQAPVQ